MTTEAPQPAQPPVHMPLPSGAAAAQLQHAGGGLAAGVVGTSPGAAPAEQDGGVPAAGASPGAAGGVEATGASPPASPQDEEAQRREDNLLKRGTEIACVRALLARAFSRPAEEPALPLRHWDYLLGEMRWLAVDVTQERLWKQTTAMAVALEVAKMQGSFGLKPPPKDCRQYSDEVRRLREAAAKEAKAAAGKRPSPAAARTVAENGGLLKLDPADDPIFADLDMLDLTPGTPPTSELSLSYQHDESFSESLHELLAETEVERLIKEEIALREYIHEFDAALVSHHLAVQEENRRALALDAGLAAEGGLDLLDGEGAGLGGAAGEEEEDAAYLGKKAAKRRKQGGYLLDDFKDLDTESMGGSQLAGAKRQASRAQIEETYFRKKRRERYRDVDVDYDISQEPTGRYATRRTAAAMGARASTRIQDQQKKKSHPMRADSYGGQQMMRQRGAAGVTGMVLWNKSEDDLLLAIAHEFSGNWTLVSEVLSLSLSMQGIYRPPAMCKQRFRQITTPESGEYNEELALINLSQTLTKQQAREMLMASLPVRDDVLMPLMEALVQIGAAAKQRRQAEEKKNDPVRSRRQEAHSSHAAVHAVVMQQTGNRTMTPLELGEAVNAAFSQQAKQQQLLAVQAMQAQSQAAAAAAAAAAGAPKGLPAQQPMQAGGAAAQQQPQPQQPGAGGQQGVAAMGGTVPGGLQMGQGGMPGGMAQQLGAGGGQLHPGQLPPGMAAPGAGGARPLLPQQGVTPQAMAQAAAAMAQQQQQQAAVATAAAGGAASAAGTPPMSLPQQQQAAGLGAPGIQATQQQQQMLARQAAANAAQQAAKNQVTLQQLNHILATNLLPNGTALPPEMRKQIEEKRNSYLAKTQAQQAQLTAQARQQQAQQVTAAQIALQQHQQAAAAAAGAGAQPGSAMPPSQQLQQGAPPGGLPAATAAAAALHLQMQQQAGAAGQAPGAGVRPPGLPPGLYAMQGLQPGASLALASGTGGQPMALPPGVMPAVSHQMSLAAAQAAQGGVPNLQPAMALQSAQLAAAAGHIPGGAPGGAAGGLPATLPPGMALPAGLTPQQQQQQLALALHHHQQQQQAAAVAAAAQQAAANQAAAHAAAAQQPTPQQTVPPQ